MSISPLQVGPGLKNVSVEFCECITLVIIDAFSLYERIDRVAHKERGLFEASGSSVKLKDKDGFISTHPGGLSYPLR